MKNFKRTLAAILAAICAFSFAGCGSKSDDSGSSDESSRKDVVNVATTDDVKSIPEGADNTLLWMANYDLNPGRNAEKTVGLNLFEQKGGKIKWQRVTSSNQYTKLGAAVASGKDAPDLFPYSALAFPCQVIQGFYQPLDDIIDFNTPMWEGVKETAEQYSLNGKHYVAPIEYYPSSYIFYDKKVINENGFDDPRTLYDSGEWDYDTMDDLMSAYVSGASGDEERYGITGFYAPQYVQQTGETIVTTDDNMTYKSNIDNPKIAAAEERLSDWRKQGYVLSGTFFNSAGEAFKQNVLFYAMGDWAATGTGGPQGSDEWGIVPFPADPSYDGEKPITTASINSFMWVKGSDKKDAARAFFECYRVAQTDPDYLQNARDKWLADNPNWTEDDYQLMKDVSNPENVVMLFEPAYGVSALMGDDNSGFEAGVSLTNRIYASTSEADQQGNLYTWTQAREKFSPLVDAELKKANEQIKKFLKK